MGVFTGHDAWVCRLQQISPLFDPLFAVLLRQLFPTHSMEWVAWHT